MASHYHLLVAKLKVKLKTLQGSMGRKYNNNNKHWGTILNLISAELGFSLDLD